MPIGFWAVSRRDIIHTVGHSFNQRFGRSPKHTPKYHKLIDRIYRTLPSALNTCFDEYIDDAMINTYTFPLEE